MAKRQASNARTTAVEQSPVGDPSNLEPTSPPVPQQSEYTVVARRYRPQQFKDLIGQEAVARALTNAIQSNRVAHAYLFTGARGVGKTSAARILAKALNCVNGPTPTPCDRCEICLGIASGEDIDVLEIDGASNRGIDEVRAIRQNVQTRPSRARFKIYIIDEVHMLTQQAFNALLKTLEEPPPHVKFIFATTEVQKIPVTILSRCQRFDFGSITTARIAEHLRHVVDAEQMKADPEALQLIARRAGGSMRDAQSLLDQLLAFGGDHLRTEQVHQLLGTAGDERILKLVEAIQKRSVPAALEILRVCEEEGLQLSEVVDQLIDYWRALMLLKCTDGKVSGLDICEPQRQVAIAQSREMTLDTILAGLDVLTTTKLRLRGSGHTTVLLEMAIIRLIRLEDLVPIARLVQTLTQGTASTPVLNRNANAASVVGASPPPAKKKPEVPPVNDRSRVGMVVHDSAQTLTKTSLNAENLPEIWERVRQDVGAVRSSHLIHAKLPAIFGPKTLAIRFAPRYTHAYDYCKEPDSIRAIEESLRKITGETYTIRVELEVSVDTESVNTEAAANPSVSHRERMDQVMQMPLLQKAVELLGARLMKLEPGFGDGPESTEREESDNPER